MDRRNNEPIKWYTISENVDIETGELINKTETENKNYIIINKTIKYELEEQSNGTKRGFRKITNECKRNPQQRLW